MPKLLSFPSFLLSLCWLKGEKKKDSPVVPVFDGDAKSKSIPVAE
jgi:hypothetical protein